jgi:HemY protein
VNARALLFFLLLAAAAIGVALFARGNTGYVMFVLPPWRVEISRNAFVVLALLAFAVLYLLLRLVLRITRLPREVREHRVAAQAARVRAKQDGAVVALLEGRYGRTRQRVEEALALPQASGLAALVGARAALETRDFDAAETFLARPDAQVASLAVPRMMLAAEVALERGLPGAALAQLAELKREAGAHTAALRLEMRALTAAQRYAEVPRVVGELVKRKVYDVPHAELIRAGAHAQALRQLAHDAAGLREYWQRLPEADRLSTRVAEAGARSFLTMGGDREAADVLARSLEARWDPALVLLYAECRTTDSTRLLETAERWLTRHSQDATLLYALGRLCERAQLWGKAQTYYEASLALDNGWRAHVALGEMLAQLGRTDGANAHLAAALKLALAELARPARH